MNRGGAGWLQRACVEAAFAPVPRFFGGLWAWGMFPPAAAIGAFNMDSPSANVCGRLQGREAGRRPTSWRNDSTKVRIMQEGERREGTPGGLFRDFLGLLHRPRKIRSTARFPKDGLRLGLTYAHRDARASASSRPGFLTWRLRYIQPSGLSVPPPRRLVQRRPR